MTMKVRTWLLSSVATRRTVWGSVLLVGVALWLPGRWAFGLMVAALALLIWGTVAKP